MNSLIFMNMLISRNCLTNDLSEKVSSSEFSYLLTVFDYSQDVVHDYFAPS